MTWPQWSPLSTSGATWYHSKKRGPDGAAMEPALDERGDSMCFLIRRSVTSSRNGARSRRAGRRGGHPGPVGAVEAAMEPALDERGDAVCASSRAVSASGRNGARSRRAGRPGKIQFLQEGGYVAAMEPALDERGDRWTGTARSAGRTGRNGARSRRAGRLQAMVWRPATQEAPQWSPLSTSGATKLRRFLRLQAYRRNGARSRRAGRPCRPSRGPRTGTRRNGARSRRAGRLVGAAEGG